MFHINLVVTLAMLFSFSVHGESEAYTSININENTIGAIDTQQNKRKLSKYQAKKLEFIDQNLNEIRKSCINIVNDVTKIKDRNVLCLHGIIRDTTKAEPPLNPEPESRNFSIAYVSSPGGDIDVAMKIGRDIFDNAAYLIVDQHCHSACGAYIAPAARRLYMTDNTVISMHGSLPRNANRYAHSRMAAKYPDLSPMEIVTKKWDEVREHIRQFPEFVKESLFPEVIYFAHIRTDEGYITRYNEILRTIAKRKNYPCKPPGGLNLIYGPELLHEFHVLTIRAWFPQEKAQYTELLAKTKNSTSFIYDFDEHPFWLPDRGLVSADDCRVEMTE